MEKRFYKYHKFGKYFKSSTCHCLSCDILIYINKYLTSLAWNACGDTKIFKEIYFFFFTEDSSYKIIQQKKKKLRETIQDSKVNYNE